uniref:Uncharacterized protein n=1 Tax=Aotus nancymaae TaxID=37293 RepID=A0A2K5E9Q1_AOTNA
MYRKVLIESKHEHSKGQGLTPNAPSLGHWFKSLGKRDSRLVTSGPLHPLPSWSWRSVSGCFVCRWDPGICAPSALCTVRCRWAAGPLAAARHGELVVLEDKEVDGRCHP